MLPLPIRLSTQMRPPISPTNRRDMSSLRPMPPYWRVAESSACWKASKTTSCLSSGMPIPVSRTRKCSSIPPPAPPRSGEGSSPFPGREGGWGVRSAPPRSREGSSPFPGREGGWGVRLTTSTQTATFPCSVNFTALPMRLASTWRTRLGSPTSARGTWGEMP